MHNSLFYMNNKFDLQSKQLKVPLPIPESLPPQPFYGKIMTGAVATRGAASYGLLLPAAN